MGWLTDITNWIRQQVERLWDAIQTFFSDLVVTTIEAVLDVFASAVEALPVPDFIGTYSIGGIMSNISSDVMWVAGSMRIGEAMGLLGAGYAARLVRKLLTLGQW